MRTVLRVGLVALLLCSFSNAQNERYELGKRTRALEAELEKRISPELRKQSMVEINKAVQRFFSLNLREAARSLDAARLVLEQNSTDAKIWAESLSVLPGFRLLDEANASVTLTLSHFYEVLPKIPSDASIRFSLMSQEGASIRRLAEFPIKELPATNKVSLGKIKAGDYFLLSEVLVGKEILAKNEQMLSVASRLNERLKALETKLSETKAGDWQIETAREHLSILSRLAEGKTLETDYQANNLLNQAEVFTKISSRFSGKNRQMTLTFPLKSGNQTSRFFIPKTYDGKRAHPVVIALHGAGGSENLFFDSYGNGKIVGLCEKRNWFLVAPRNFGFDAEKLDDFIENLSKIYKIDRTKIFLIGHSMGSIQGLGLATSRPKTFAAIALISAGGSPKVSEEMKSLPFFIGTGTADFSLRGSQNLQKILSDAGVKRLEYKVYDDIEHLTAVQFSLNDAFQFFDEFAKK